MVTFMTFILDGAWPKCLLKYLYCFDTFKLPVMTHY